MRVIVAVRVHLRLLIVIVALLVSVARVLLSELLIQDHVDLGLVFLIVLLLVRSRIVS